MGSELVDIRPRRARPASLKSVTLIKITSFFSRADASVLLNRGNYMLFQNACSHIVVTEYKRAM